MDFHSLQVQIKMHVRTHAHADTHQKEPSVHLHKWPQRSISDLPTSGEKKDGKKSSMNRCKAKAYWPGDGLLEIDESFKAVPPLDGTGAQANDKFLIIWLHWSARTCSSWCTDPTKTGFLKESAINSKPLFCIIVVPRLRLAVRAEKKVNCIEWTEGI